MTVYRVTQRQATKSLYCHLKLPSTAWILIHSSMRDCSIESLVMEGTALNSMYFFRTQPKYLRGEKSMSVTLGGAAEEEVENYRRLVKVGIVPKEKNRGNAVLMEGKVM